MSSPKFYISWKIPPLRKIQRRFFYPIFAILLNKTGLLESGLLQDVEIPLSYLSSISHRNPVVIQ